MFSYEHQQSGRTCGQVGDGYADHRYKHWQANRSLRASNSDQRNFGSIVLRPIGVKMYAGHTMTFIFLHNVCFNNIFPFWEIFKGLHPRWEQKRGRSASKISVISVRHEPRMQLLYTIITTSRYQWQSTCNLRTNSENTTESSLVFYIANLPRRDDIEKGKK